MSEPPELVLPELTQADLDGETLGALVDDLNNLTQILEVITKGGEFSMAGKTSIPLREAVRALQRGQIRGVQVRYVWRDEEWMDTLLRGPAGVRIVRMKANIHPSS